MKVSNILSSLQKGFPLARLIESNVASIDTIIEALKGLLKKESQLTSVALSQWDFNAIANLNFDEAKKQKIYTLGARILLGVQRLEKAKDQDLSSLDSIIESCSSILNAQILSLLKERSEAENRALVRAISFFNKTCRTQPLLYSLIWLFKGIEHEKDTDVKYEEKLNLDRDAEESAQYQLIFDVFDNIKNSEKVSELVLDISYLFRGGIIKPLIKASAMKIEHKQYLLKALANRERGQRVRFISNVYEFLSNIKEDQQSFPIWKLLIYLINLEEQFLLQKQLSRTSVFSFPVSVLSLFQHLESSIKALAKDQNIIEVLEFINIQLKDIPQHQQGKLLSFFFALPPNYRQNGQLIPHVNAMLCTLQNIKKEEKEKITGDLLQFFKTRDDKCVLKVLTFMNSTSNPLKWDARAFACFFALAVIPQEQFEDISGLLTKLLAEFSKIKASIDLPIVLSLLVYHHFSTQTLQAWKVPETTHSYLLSLLRPVAQKLCDGTKVVQDDELMNNFKRQLQAYAMSDKWDHYVIRGCDIENWSMYNNQGSQEAYGRLMHQARIEVETFVKEKDPNFEQLLDFVSQHRELIALALDHTSGYGKKRKDSKDTCYTTLNSGSLALSLKEQDQSLPSSYSNFSRDARYKITNDYNNFKYSGTVIGYIKGEAIPLSRIYFLENSEVAVLIDHTDPTWHPKIKAYLSEIYEQIKENRDRSFLLYASSTIFWWGCEGKFWVKGDPSTFELLIWGAILREEKPRWQEGVIPWGEATVQHDVDIFCNNFYSLLEL